jgi:hypothetical protein
METGLELGWDELVCTVALRCAVIVCQFHVILSNLVPSLIHVDMVDQKMLEMTYDAKKERDESMGF